jgi:hypothetical protein
MLPLQNGPPEAVEPYKFPSASMIKPARGQNPRGSLAKKLCNTFSVHSPFAVGLNSKATPQLSSRLHPESPPLCVVPYKLPAASKTNPA